MPRMNILVKHCVPALLACATLPSYALKGTVEFTGALVFFNDTFKVSNLDGFSVTPVGFRDDDFPLPTGSTGEFKDISLASPEAVDVPGFLMFNAAPFARFDLAGIQAGIFCRQHLWRHTRRGTDLYPSGFSRQLRERSFWPCHIGFYDDFLCDWPDGGRPGR